MKLPIKVLNIDKHKAVIEIADNVGGSWTEEVSVTVGHALKELIRRYAQLDEDYKDLYANMSDNYY